MAFKMLLQFWYVSYCTVMLELVHFQKFVGKRSLMIKRRMWQATTVIINFINIQCYLKYFDNSRRLKVRQPPFKSHGIVKVSTITLYVDEINNDCYHF